MSKFISIFIFILVTVLVSTTVGFVIWFYYRKTIQEAKNYERGLKMVPLRIHLPPPSLDINTEGRDYRSVNEETISQAQVMYNIISSISQKGFQTRLSGQRHVSFEIVASGGMVHYYVVAPLMLLGVVKQAISTAYPSAVLEEVRGDNIFSEKGKMSGTIGGEFNLKKSFIYPINTYVSDGGQGSSRALLNAISTLEAEDGVAVQMLVRPADENWSEAVDQEIKVIKSTNGQGGANKPSYGMGELLEVLWKPPKSGENVDKKTAPADVDQTKLKLLEDKLKYPAFETLIRIVVSSNTYGKSQSILQNITSSFSLFDSQQSNGFEFNYTKNVDEITTAYIMRFFPQSIKENILNSVELATIFHLPNQKDIPSSQVMRQSFKQVDGPNEVPNEGLLLGYNEFRGAKKPIRLSQNDRRRHTYFIGQTGTGKSVLLENLAFQDMMDGKGFAFIDPHGDSVEKLLGMIPKERVDDVIYFNPSDIEAPIGLNLFEFESGDQRDFVIQEGIQMLYRLYDPGHTGIVGPRFEHWFRNAALTIMADPNGSTFIDIPQVFNDQSFADYKLKHVKDQTVIDFWQKEMAQTTGASKSDVLGWFASKFGAFLSNEMMRNILGQTKSGINIREIMDNNKILLVNLSKGKTGELNSMLLGMIFVMKFQVAAMSRANLPEDQRKDFCLYVDEFQNFATDSFESILSEARKYKLNIIVANQFMTQLTDKIREAIIGNVGTIISGRIGVTDAEMLSKKFTPTFNVEDLTRLPNFQTIASVMINNVPSAPFSMNLIPPMSKSNPQLRDALKKLSSSKYGKPRGIVSQQILERLSVGDIIRKENLELINNKQETLPKNETDFLDNWLEKRKLMKSNDYSNETDKSDVKKAIDGFTSGRLSALDVSKEKISKEAVEPDYSIDFRNEKAEPGQVDITIRK